MKIERDEGGAGHPRRARAESSVVFSLANLRALADSDAQARAPALPSFAGRELVGVATARAPQPQPVPTVAAPSNLPLVMMLGLLLVATIALGAYVVATPRPQVVITHVLAPTPDEVETIAPPPVIATTREPEVVAPIDPPPVEQPVRKTTARKQTRTHHEQQRVAVPQPQPERRGDVPLECVLDPNLPKCGGTQRTPPPREKTNVDPDLPETLGSTAIRNGIAPVKLAAKTCGSKFGADPGEQVRVKLSIVGATGAVSSTAAEDPHRGTALGNCVAAALKKASFPHFRKSVIGVEYTITL